MDTYEKKYKKALGKAREWYNNPNSSSIGKSYLYAVFPELKESDDERIRKELIEHVKDQQSSFISAPDCRDKYEEEENNKYNAWLAWLEKQSEKNYVTTEEDEKAREQVVYAINQLHVCECTKNKLLAWLEKRGEQKPDWGEEDEKMINAAISFIEHSPFSTIGKGKKNTIAWLKSLKQRIKKEAV